MPHDEPADTHRARPRHARYAAAATAVVAVLTALPVASSTPAFADDGVPSPEVLVWDCNHKGDRNFFGNAKVDSCSYVEESTFERSDDPKDVITLDGLWACTPEQSLQQAFTVTAGSAYSHQISTQWGVSGGIEGGIGDGSGNGLKGVVSAGGSYSKTDTETWSWTNTTTSTKTFTGTPKSGAVHYKVTYTPKVHVSQGTIEVHYSDRVGGHYYWFGPLTAITPVSNGQSLIGDWGQDPVPMTRDEWAAHCSGPYPSA